jgi:hypothetical protein
MLLNKNDNLELYPCTFEIYVTIIFNIQEKAYLRLSKWQNGSVNFLFVHITLGCISKKFNVVRCLIVWCIGTLVSCVTTCLKLHQLKEVMLYSRIRQDHMWGFDGNAKLLSNRIEEWLNKNIWWISWGWRIISTCGVWTYTWQKNCWCWNKPWFE